MVVKEIEAKAKIKGFEIVISRDDYYNIDIDYVEDGELVGGEYDCLGEF